jgi:preprotein translocase subunit Sec63
MMADPSSEHAKTSKMKPKSKKSKKEGFSWMLFVGILVCAIAVIAMKIYGSEYYDVDYDEFQSNYYVLGLTPEAPIEDVKRAFRELSRKW